MTSTDASTQRSPNVSSHNCTNTGRAGRGRRRKKKQQRKNTTSTPAASLYSREAVSPMFHGGLPASVLFPSLVTLMVRITLPAKSISDLMHNCRFRTSRTDGSDWELLLLRQPRYTLSSTSPCLEQHVISLIKGESLKACDSESRSLSSLLFSSLLFSLTHTFLFVNWGLFLQERKKKQICISIWSVLRDVSIQWWEKQRNVFCGYDRAACQDNKTPLSGYYHITPAGRQCCGVRD